MRIITIGLSVLLFGFAFAVLAQESTTENEDEPCGISFAYQEAIDENRHSLTRITLMAATGGNSPLTEPDTIRLFYRQMLSMRQYHEEMRERLPECAQDINDAYIGAITAAQDILAFGLAHFAIPEDTLRNQAYVVDAQEYLQEQWARVNAASQATELVVVE